MLILVKFNGGFHGTSTSTRKRTVISRFRHEEINEVPWVPFAGIHAGQLKNYTATEILQILINY